MAQFILMGKAYYYSHASLGMGLDSVSASVLNKTIDLSLQNTLEKQQISNPSLLADCLK